MSDTLTGGGHNKYLFHDIGPRYNGNGIFSSRIVSTLSNHAPGCIVKVVLGNRDVSCAKVLSTSFNLTGLYLPSIDLNIELIVLHGDK
jgi:hypothetical protein